MPTLLARLRQSKAELWAVPAAGAIMVAAVVITLVRSIPVPHLTVEVVNETGAPMADVHFLFSEGRGERQSEQIPEGGRVAWELKGQSRGFLLRYRDAKDEIVSRKCEYALDGDDWGKILLHVKQGGIKVVTEFDAVSKDSNH